MSNRSGDKRVWAVTFLLSTKDAGVTYDLYLCRHVRLTRPIVASTLTECRTRGPVSWKPIGECPGVESGVDKILRIAVVIEEVIIDVGRQSAHTCGDTATAVWRRGNESIAVVRDDATGIEDQEVAASPESGHGRAVVCREAEELFRRSVAWVLDGDGPPATRSTRQGGDTSRANFMHVVLHSRRGGSNAEVSRTSTEVDAARGK